MSAKFPDELRYAGAGMANGSLLIQLTDPFRYISSIGTVFVPRHTVSDGASIPRLFWPWLGPFGSAFDRGDNSYFRAAIIHDYLYSPNNDEFSRAEADEVFLEAMQECKVPWHRRTIIYTAVRCAGWRFFKGTALT